jgi:hypothetical protein
MLTRVLYRFNRSHAIEAAILSIEGIAVTTGALVGGSLVVVGIISGPVGWAALGAVTTAFALIGLGIGIGSIVLAAKQQKVSESMIYVGCGSTVQIRMRQKVVVLRELQRAIISYTQPDE